MEHPINKYIQLCDEFEKKANHSKTYEKNNKKIIKFLALNGSHSTWNISKKLFSNLSVILTDQMIRRYFLGRSDIYINKNKNKNKKFSSGLLSFNLVQKKKDINGNNIYGLTIFGILYALKINNFSSKQLFEISKHYPDVLPMVFGKSNYLQKNGVNLNSLKLLARSNMIDLHKIVDGPAPYLEMMNLLLIIFPHKHYVKTLEDFVQFWFYTYLIMLLRNNHSFNPNKIFQRWNKLISNDDEIKSWFFPFLYNTNSFYSHRNEDMNKFFDTISEF